MKTKGFLQELKPSLMLPLVCITSVSLADGSGKDDGGFNKLLTLEGISFHVVCPNQGSLNQLTITPDGLEIDNSAIRQEINGSVTDAEVADLNADGSPELYVYVTSAGSGSYGELIAYSANNKKSLSGIYLPPLTEDRKNSQGYMGHDDFAIVENRLIRRFPVYKAKDANANPSGGTRELYYKLVPGEAGWLLKLDKRVSYD